jgi:hypothetical protein
MAGQQPVAAAASFCITSVPQRSLVQNSRPRPRARSIPAAFSAASYQIELVSAPSVHGKEHGKAWRRRTPALDQGRPRSTSSLPPATQPVRARREGAVTVCADVRFCSSSFSNKVHAPPFSSLPSVREVRCFILGQMLSCVSQHFCISTFCRNQRHDRRRRTTDESNLYRDESSTKTSCDRDQTNLDISSAEIQV